MAKDGVIIWHRLCGISINFIRLKHTIYLLAVIVLLTACKKDTDNKGINDNTPPATNGGGGSGNGGGSGGSGTVKNGAEKTYGVYEGYMTYHSYKTVNGAATTKDSAFATNIVVTQHTTDSIAVSLNCCFTNPFRFYYEGHYISSGWSFMSHPGGTEYRFKYNPDTDSSTFYFKTYSTTYVTPVNASGYTYSFAGKKQ